MPGRTNRVKKQETTKKTTTLSKKPLNTEQKDTIKPPEHGMYYCTSCGHGFKKQQGNFRRSSSPMFAGNNGYINICVSCLVYYEKAYTEYFKDSDRACIRLCEIFNWYVNDAILTSSMKKTSNTPRITSIITKGHLFPNQDKIYDHRIMEKPDIIDAINVDDDDSHVDGYEYNQQGVESGVVSQIIKSWGSGFDPQDYDFLDNQFTDWKSRTVIDGKSREDLVRELCIMKLQMNKALQSNNTDLYIKMANAYTKMLDSANLSPKQEDASDKAGEKPIGVMLEMFENERPISPPKEEWLNSHMYKLITVYFIGHLAKMLGLKNKYSQMYEDEMNRYRVEISELENAEDDDIFDYLFNETSDSPSSLSETENILNE